MRLLLLLALLLPRLAVSADTAATGTVSGSVRYADTGKPASGIRLWLTAATAQAGIRPDPRTGEYVLQDTREGQERLFAMVGADGTFEVHDVPAGAYLVHTFSPVYLSPDDTVFPTSDSEHVTVGPQTGSRALRVEVTAKEPKQRLQIALQRGGAIEGQIAGARRPVTGMAGMPLGLAVNAERKLKANHYARVGGAAHADAGGHYRLEGLAPGDYVVFSASSPTMVRTADGGMGAGSGLPVYAPGTVRPSHATVVHVHGSETHQLNFSAVVGGAVHRVAGTLDLSGGEVPRSTVVRLYPAGEGGLTAATPLNAAREYAFEQVPNGEYTASVEFAPTSEFVSADVAHGTIRMRMRKPAYDAVTQNVHVAGQDVTGVILKPRRAMDAENQSHSTK